jgi:hypothetical protein
MTPPFSGKTPIGGPEARRSRAYPLGKGYTVSVDAELKRRLIDMERRASVNEMEGRTLAAARSRAISAALQAIDMEIESFADLVSRLRGNQPQ